MTQTASSYTDTLRLHVVPRRLSVAELRILPDGYALPTLLPERRLDVMRTTAYAAGFSVGGVEIAFPGLFYGHHIAVHGLAGILNLRSNAVPGAVVPPSHPPVAPPISSIDRRWRTIPNFPENQTILPPSFRPVRTVPKSVSFNVTSKRRPHPQVVAPVPRSSPVRRQAPAPVHYAVSRQAPAPVPYAVSRQAPAPVPSGASSPAPSTSPVNVTVDAPASVPEADGIIHSSPSLDEDPVVSPAVSAPMFLDSEITLPPEGFSEVTVPAPAGMELVVRENHSHNVSIMKSSGDLEGVMETTTETPQALDGVRKCDLGVGVKDDHGDIHIMQCYAS